MKKKIISFSIRKKRVSFILSTIAKMLWLGPLRLTYASLRSSLQKFFSEIINKAERNVDYLLIWNEPECLSNTENKVSIHTEKTRFWKSSSPAALDIPSDSHIHRASAKPDSRSTKKFMEMRKQEKTGCEVQQRRTYNWRWT